MPPKYTLHFAMDVEPTFVPFLTGFTYTTRRYTPDINTEADESVELDLTSKFGLLGVEEPKSAIVVDEFRCGIKGCKSTFTDVNAYEAHYNSAHKNVCQFCKKIYPTPFWLELHVLEHHDNYFKLLSTRQNMYQCLVESCQEKFINEEKRKQHLIHVHAYPKSFDFQNLTARSIKRKPKKSSKEGPTNSTAKNSPTTETKAKQPKKPRNPFNKMDIEVDDTTSGTTPKESRLDSVGAEPDLMTTEQREEPNHLDQSETKPGVTDATNIKTPPAQSKRGNKHKNFNHRAPRGGSRHNASRGTMHDDKTNTENRSTGEENSMQVETGAPQVVFRGSVPKSFNFGRGRGRGLQHKSPARDYFQRTDNTTKEEPNKDVQMKN